MKGMGVEYLIRGFNATIGYYGIFEKERRSYKMNVFIKFVGFPVRIFLPLVLWAIVAQASSSAQDFLYYAIYYVGVFVITLMYPYTRISVQTVASEILNGDLIRYIARGIPYWSVRLADWLSAILYYLGTVVVLYVIVAKTVMQNISFLHMVQFFIALFIGSLIQLVLWVMVGMSAFLLERVQGIARIYMVTQDLSTGALIPLTFLPHAIETIASWLPFQYFVFIPLQILLGQYSFEQGLVYIGTGIVWLGVLLGISGMIWRIGLKHFIASQA
ncbi:MAG: ABC-2 family transporter protein [Thermicanus sp.]|nr:ABC-2 family transporter protein [Thermicanus sp.]